MKFYENGWDISGDVIAVRELRGGPAALDVTAISKSGHERIGGIRDGALGLTAWFNDAGGAEHPLLSALPTADVVTILAMSDTLGDPAFCMVAKQVNYAGNRGADGSFTFDADFLPNAFGPFWGQLLTAGVRTDTGATNGASLDGAAATSFGMNAFLGVTAFTGTDATIKLQDSADNATFADITAGAFAQVTSAPLGSHIVTAATATIRRYVRVATVTTGGFASLSFVVAFIRHATLTIT